MLALVVLQQRLMPNCNERDHIFAIVWNAIVCTARTGLTDLRKF